MKRTYWLLLAIFWMGTSVAQAQSQATLVLNDAQAHQTISRYIYGMFSEHLGRDIYDGIWVGKQSTIPNKDGIRLDVVEALKRIHVPVMRWPGGCFADEYHWKDGVGDPAQRPKTINTNWGGVTETNAFGTHEFLEFCRLVGCDPYIAGNVGSGTVQEMSEWVEYLNSNQESSITDWRRRNGQDSAWKVPFWGVGNESWGCGGNMTPEYYADLYRRYASFCKNYPGAPLKKIASGPNGNDLHWMEVLLQDIPHWMMWGISLHYYTVPTGNWSHKGSATQFGEDEYFSTLKRALFMDRILHDQEALMNRYDPQKRLALVVDEWGVWTDVEPGTNPAFLYQQNSLRDALVAASTLNIFNQHCDRVRMANLAQTVNVLQSVILTHGAQMLLTPTYWVFDLYQVHQDARLVPLQLLAPYYVFGNDSLPAINASASIDSTGALHISLVNIDPAHTIPVKMAFAGSMNWKFAGGRLLTSAHVNDCNTFEHPDLVHPVSFSDVRQTGDVWTVNMPAKSVVVLTLKK